jgi:hypothetical protein
VGAGGVTALSGGGAAGAQWVGSFMRAGKAAALGRRGSQQQGPLSCMQWGGRTGQRGKRGAVKARVKHESKRTAAAVTAACPAGPLARPRSRARRACLASPGAAGSTRSASAWRGTARAPGRTGRWSCAGTAAAGRRRRCLFLFLLPLRCCRRRCRRRCRRAPRPRSRRRAGRARQNLGVGVAGGGPGLEVLGGSAALVGRGVGPSPHPRMHPFPPPAPPPRPR